MDTVSLWVGRDLREYLWCDAMHDTLKHHGVILASIAHEVLIQLSLCLDFIQLVISQY